MCLILTFVNMEQKKGGRMCLPSTQLTLSYIVMCETLSIPL